MVDKQQYQDVITEVEASKASIDLLAAKIRVAEGFEHNEKDLSSLYGTLSYIDYWATLRIADMEKKEVLNEFLSSLKELMSEYSAVFDVVDTSSSGYGVAYGQGDNSEPLGIKISINKEGTQASKIFETLSFSEEDI